MSPVTRTGDGAYVGYAPRLVTIESAVGSLDVSLRHANGASLHLPELHRAAHTFDSKHVAPLLVEDCEVLDGEPTQAVQTKRWSPFFDLGGGTTVWLACILRARICNARLCDARIHEGPSIEESCIELRGLLVERTRGIEDPLPKGSQANTRSVNRSARAVDLKKLFVASPSKC
jgi:hypothetical protein